MDKDRFIDDHNYSFSERVRSNRLSSLSCNLIRFSILLIAIFLIFSITANDETQIAYASDNLTDLELESTNLYAINDSSTNQTTSETSNSSSELIDPSGTVTSWTGYPISDLTVSAWQGSQLISQTVTDGDGAYNLVLPQGNYEITAGGLTIWGDEYLPQTQQVDVQEPVTVNFQGMLLKNSVYGMITDENGNPLQYTMAEVYDEEGNCLDDNDASADGHYKLDLSYYFSQQDPSVTSGTFTVLFYDDLLEDQEFTIQVNRDEAYKLDTIMQPVTILKGSVSGQSTEITGRNGNAVYIIWDLNGSDESVMTTIDENYNYQFIIKNPQITNNAHYISLNLFGYQNYYEPINLNPHVNNTHNIILQEQNIAQVSVVNSTGQPIPGATVSMEIPQNQLIGTTDPNGIVNFAVEDDDWTICASHLDYNKVVKYLTVSGGGTHQLDFTLIKEDLPATLEGYVTDSVTGAPISNCYVSMGFSNGEYQYVDTMTDANGHYVFDSSLFEEEFYSGLNVDLNAEKQDYNPYFTSFILPEGLFTYNISLVHDTILWGSVTDPDGNVVYADVTLSYVHNGETVEQSTNIDECGYYRFEGITPADDSQYHLSAQHSFYLPYQTILNVLPNQSTQHDIIMNYYGGSVTVNILNTQGQGISGVTVSIGNETFAIVKTTDATGSTTFQHIPDGNWTIEANYAGYSPATAPVSISGGSSEQVTLTLIQQGLPVTMEGYVTDAVDGSPLNNAQIYFWPSTHPTQTNIYTKTDSNGYYKLSSAQFSEFVSGLSGVLDVRPFQHEKPKISMTIGEGPQIQYNLQLNPYTGSITVHLIDITHNQPVQGLTVYLWGDEDQETTSDATGTAVFEKVGPSDWWEICTYDPNNEYYYWDGYYYPLIEGEHLEITAFMVPTIIAANIGGTVVDDTNNVVPGARVELSLINGNWIYAWSIKTTDVYGKFLMDLDNTANLMRVTISKTGYQTTIYDFNPTDLPINQIFVLQPDFSLTTLVDGYVQDFLENPLSGVSVDFYRGSTLYQTTYTNPAGYYNINLPVGVYQMYVHQTDFITQNQGFTIFYGSGHHFDYTLLKDSSLYGSIVGSDSVHECYVPLNGATINILQNGNLFDSTISNSNGLYQSNSVPPGDYTIQAFAPYYDTAEIEPITILDGSGTYLYLMLQPSASCNIYGYVTDKSSGLPLSGANVTLWYGDDMISYVTDLNGYYSFTNLKPEYYELDFTANGYINEFAHTTLSLGQELEINKTMELTIPCTIKGTVNCWAGPVSGAVVTLDGTNTATTSTDGSFQFDNIAMGTHWVLASKDGIINSWSPTLNNGETISNSIYLTSNVLETDPGYYTVINTTEQVKVKVMGSRPYATGVNIDLSIYGPNAWGYYGWQPLHPGTINYTDDWITYTPYEGFFSSQGRYTAHITLGNEIDYSWIFYVYNPTNNLPVISYTYPSDVNIGTFLRNPGTISISAFIDDDPGNIISSADSSLYFDGVHLPTTLSGYIDFGWELSKWTLSAEVTPTHGWHTIKVVAVDTQGLTTEYEWQIFTSLMAPVITDLDVPQLFSPHTGGMGLSAKISEPIRNAILSFGNGFKSINLGNYNDILSGWWNGVLEPGIAYGDSWLPSGYPYIPDDGVISFYITGQTIDGLFFSLFNGSSVIDSHAPVIIMDSKTYFDNHAVTVHGSISDYSGISSFEAVTNGGTLTSSLSGGLFTLDLNVDNDGEYVITVTSTDLAGNVASVSKTIRVDTVDPTISFLSPEAGTEVRPGQVLSFHLGDDYSGLHRDYITYHPQLYPLIIDVILDDNSIKDLVTYSDFSYGFYEYNEEVHGWAASLLGITGTYDPKLNGYLTDGNHTLNITLQDMAGNKIERILHFSSITKIPDVTEKDMNMTVSIADQTLYFSGIVQENSDRGFKNIRLFLDSVAVPESMVFTNNEGLPYQGTVSWTITRNFTPGAHTLTLWVIDNLDLENTLDTGFYYLPKVLIDNEGFVGSTDYLAEVPLYTNVHEHTVCLDPSTFFKQGSQALYGYCRIFAPSNVLYDPAIPMGSQQAFTYAQSAYVNAQDATHVSLWMTDILDGHSSYWGWGEGVAVYFDDGTGALPYLPTNFDQWFDGNNPENTDNILYIHHEPPWANPAGKIDQCVATAGGADGKIWKQYVVEIPAGVDKSHLSIVILWRAINWNSWGADVSNYISSKIDNIEFFTALVTDVSPADGSEGVGLQPVVAAKYSIPLDPETFTSDTFYLKNTSGIKVATNNYYNANTFWGSMTPLQKLNGENEYIACVSQNIRTIYGKILPEPDPYEWSFTTREGESLLWQSILYNGEQYDIFLTFGDGYNGNKPGYISPSTIASITGAPLLGVYVTKKGYEIANMDLKKKILVAAERKAFYETLVLAYYGRLISQSNIDWADSGANTWSGDFLDNLSNFLPGGNPSPPPDAQDVIQDTITTALADGSDPYGVPGAINSALSWFSTIVGGCDTVNSLISALNKVKPSGITTTIEESCAGDVLEVAGLVSSELAFQKDLWDFVYKTMWQIEIADKYYNELSYIKSCSSGDTYNALNNLLSTDSDDIKDLVAQKVAEHIADQTVDVIRDAVWEAIKDAGPYGKALYFICKGFNLVLDKLGVLDVHSKCHAALDEQDAEYNTYRAWVASISLMNYITLETPDDMALISTSSKLRYSSAADFYTTLASACEIVKNWPFSDTAGYNSVLPSYYSTANDYYSHASNVIPEILNSNADLNALFSIIRQGVSGKVAYIQIGAHSPIALLVTDEFGRRIGYDPITGQNVNDFAPDGGYTGPYTEPQLISIPATMGKLIIQAFGTGSGSYTIDLETYDANGLLISGSSWTGTAIPGVTQIFTMGVDSYGDISPVDSHPPEITVNGIIDGGCYTTGVTPQILVTDDNLQNWFATLNDNIYTGELVTTEGVYSLFIRATDGINVVYKTIKFSIDLTPPQINILGFTNGDYYPMVHPYLNVIDDNLAIVSLNLDGTPISEDPVRTEGQHTITATATDKAGHQTTASATFTIDHTNPTINIQGLTDGTIYTGSVTPTININDLNLASTNILLDGNTYNSGTPITNTLHHNLTINATDKAGNQATQEIWFTVIPNGGVIITDAGGTANSGSTNLNFPTNAVSEDTAVTIHELNGISNIPPNLIYAGHAFNVLAENLQDGSQTNQLNQPVIITLHYLDSDIIGIDENTLQIFYWNTTTLTWEALPSTLDTVNNIITTSTNHISTFSMMGILIPPEITIDGVIDGTYYPTTVTPQITVTSNYLQSWFATLNGNNYTRGTTITNEGTYTLHVTATDGTNTVEKTLNFSIDLTPPTINILEPQNNGFYPSVQPSINIIDNNLASTTINLDGTPLQQGTIIQDEGQHTITATATDKAGHQTTASATFTIDRTKPTITIFGLVNGTVYQGEVTPTININDLNLASTNILLDGNTYNSGTPITNTLHHNLTINATDKAGNQATQEIWFTIIPPGGSIINATGGTTTPGQVNLNFPNGALDEDTVITMNDISGTSNPANFLFAGHAFDITAVNLHDGSQTNQLNQPVLITFHYLDSDIAGLEENTLQIFYWNTTTSTWEALPSVVDTANNIVTAYIGHLSIYALMGRPIQEPSNPNTPENQPVQTSTTTQQNSGTTQNSSIISGYPTSNLLISAPLTLQSPSSAATVPAQQQQPNTGETTPGINNWIIYALVFLVAVTLIVLLIKRIIKS